MEKVDIKNNSKLSWFIADRWFRILEFSLILGLLDYFAKITNHTAIKIVSYLSWVLLWSYFEDIGNLIYKTINSKHKLNKYKKVITWLLSMVMIFIIYLLVTLVADIIILQQNK